MKPPRNLLGLAILLYFAEGFPFGLITELLPVYLRTQGVSRSAIGLLSTIGLVWTLKLFWSPLVDRYGSYRRWIQGGLTLIVISLLGLAFLQTTSMPLFWALVTLMAIGSATQDIAIDAYTITATPTAKLGLINSVRVSAYRVAIIVAGGALAALADRAGWSAIFFASTLIALLLLAMTFLVEDRQVRREDRVSPLAGVRHWMRRGGFGAILAVILLYRLGDSLLTPMVKVFWIDQGYTATETGAVTTIAGMIFTILGAFVGGALMTKSGIYRALLWLGLLQMLSNIGYAMVASFSGGRGPMYVVAGIEQFCGGLGIAAFLGFLMAICDIEFAAVEYALLSALFGLSRQLAGTFSGILTDHLGYPTYFWLTVAAAIPGLLILPLIRKPLAEREGDRDRRVGEPVETPA